MTHGCPTPITRTRLGARKRSGSTTPHHAWRAPTLTTILVLATSTALASCTAATGLRTATTELPAAATELPAAATELPATATVPPAAATVLPATATTGVSAGWMSISGPATPPCAEPPLEDVFHVPADVSSWQVYEDAGSGFRIRYPPDWVYDDRTFDRSATDSKKAVESVTWRPSAAHGDFVWRLNVLDEPYEWSLNAVFPSLGGNRFGRSEPIAIHGVSGSRHVAIACNGESLRTDTVVVAHSGRTYVLIGDTDVSFDSFVQSLEFLP